jgi:hypothetical protein
VIPSNAYRKKYMDSDLYIWELENGNWYWRAFRGNEPVNGGVADSFGAAFDDARVGARIVARLAWAELWRWDPETEMSVYRGTDKQWESYMGYPRPEVCREPPRDYAK